MNINDFNKKLSNFNFSEGIHGKDDFFNSVVLLLLVPIKNEYHLLFQKRAKTIRQGGDICFPGGKIDKEDYTLIDTALRETYEETGIPAEKINILGRLNTIAAPMGALIDAYIGTADINIDDIKINKSEVEYVFTVPLSFFISSTPDSYDLEIKVHPTVTDSSTGEEIIIFPAKELGLPEMYHKPWGNYKYKVYSYKYKDNIIWGITARFILDLIKKFNLAE